MVVELLTTGDRSGVCGVVGSGIMRVVALAVVTREEDMLVE